jgi:hypothetical protein
MGYYSHEDDASAIDSWADYMGEAYGSEIEDLRRMHESDMYWDEERDIDIRDLQDVVAPQNCPHVVRCVKTFLWAIWTLQQGSDYIPF